MHMTTQPAPRRSNGARSATNANAPSDNVEFVVKTDEPLVLEGDEMSIVRVPANDSYSCLMLKNQRFSSLFRHYSKHHGLPRDRLEFFFTNKLFPDDTPESVHLQHGDVITVRKMQSQDDEKRDKIPTPSDSAYFDAMYKLLEGGQDTDMVFKVGKQGTVIKAHRVILMTRSEVFRAMLDRRRGGMRESVNGEIKLEDYSPDSVSRMLEYIYTNRVKQLNEVNDSQLIDLLSLAEQYILTELKYLCEAAGAEILSDETVARLLFASERFNALSLKQRCIDFILQDVGRITGHESFREEVQQYPALALTLLEAAAGVEPPVKRRRVEGSTIADGE